MHVNEDFFDDNIDNDIINIDDNSDFDDVSTNYYWFNIILDCAICPKESLRKIAFSEYWNRMTNNISYSLQMLGFISSSSDVDTILCNLKMNYSSTDMIPVSYKNVNELYKAAYKQGIIIISLKCKGDIYKLKKHHNTYARNIEKFQNWLSFYLNKMTLMNIDFNLNLIPYSEFSNDEEENNDSVDISFNTVTKEKLDKYNIINSLTNSSSDFNPIKIETFSSDKQISGSLIKKCFEKKYSLGLIRLIGNKCLQNDMSLEYEIDKNYEDENTDFCLDEFYINHSREKTVFLLKNIEKQISENDFYIRMVYMLFKTGRVVYRYLTNLVVNINGMRYLVSYTLYSNKNNMDLVKLYKTVTSLDIKNFHL